MNAVAHGQANALAHGCFSGSVTRTVHANRREGNGPSRPDHTGPEVVGETSHHDRHLGDVAGSLDGMMSYATINPLPDAHARTIRRFGRYAAPGESCWEWTGEVNHKGYGRLWNGARLVSAHRFSYEIYVGPIPADLEVGHLCHNRRCVNPAHLQVMTHGDNLRMRFAREGAPSATLGRPMTSKERNARYRARQRERLEQERLESGWWVQI